MVECRRARKHGLIAAFMAKPFMGCSANGHHHNLSLIGANFLGDLIDQAPFSR